MRDAQDTRNQSVGGTAMFGGSEPNPAFAVDESNKVDRFFPKPVTLTLPDHTQRKWPAGLHKVPVQLADHPWLKANGVIEPQSGQVAPQMMLQAPPGSQAHAAAVMQSGVYDATLVPRHDLSDADVQSADTMASLASENLKIAQEAVEKAQQTCAHATQAAADARARLEKQSPAQDDRSPDEVRAARADKLTARMREDYDALETDEERDAFLDEKKR